MQLNVFLDGVTGLISTDPRTLQLVFSPFPSLNIRDFPTNLNKTASNEDFADYQDEIKLSFGQPHNRARYFSGQ